MSLDTHQIAEAFMSQGEKTNCKPNNSTSFWIFGAFDIKSKMFSAQLRSIPKHSVSIWIIRTCLHSVKCQSAISNCFSAVLVLLVQDPCPMDDSKSQGAGIG